MVIIIREILMKTSLKVSTIITCLLYGVWYTPYRLLHVLDLFRPDYAGLPSCPPTLPISKCIPLDTENWIEIVNVIDWYMSSES